MAVAICRPRRSICRSEMALAEGETLWTPYLYASYSANGLNGMSQQFHRYLRERIIRFPGNKPRPVHLNTWEDLFRPRPGLHHAYGRRSGGPGRRALYYR